MREVVKEIQLNIGNHRVKYPTEPLDGLLLFVVDTPNMIGFEILVTWRFITVRDKIITNLYKCMTLILIPGLDNIKQLMLVLRVG